MGRRHASVVARQRRTENLDRIILPANDRLACNGPCDGVSGELYNPPDINELSLPFAFKVLVSSFVVSSNTTRWRKSGSRGARSGVSLTVSVVVPNMENSSNVSCSVGCATMNEV